MRLLVLSAAAFILVSTAQRAHAETPTPAAATTATVTAVLPSPTPPAEATPVVTIGTPAPSDAPPSLSSIEVTLIEDLNSSASRDSADGKPTASTLVELIPWSRTKESLGVYDPEMVVLSGLTGEDGVLHFVDVPPDSYTLRVWWSSGFLSGGSATVPDVYQVVFTLDDRGTISAVDSSKYLPGVLGDQKGQAKEIAANDGVPREIVLNMKPAGLFPYPVATGGVVPISVGTINVRAALRGSDVILPDTGREAPEGRALGLYLVIFGFLAAICLLGITATIRRR